MKGLKQLAGVSLAAMASLSAYGWGSSNLAVGTVDVQKIFASPDGAQKIQTALEQKFSSQRDDLQQVLNKLQEQQKAYQDNKDKWSKTTLASKEKAFNEEKEKFQKDQAQYQQQYAAAQSREMDKFLNAVKNAAKQVAKKDKLSVVLVKNSVLYAEDTKDVTSEVWDKIN